MAEDFFAKIPRNFIARAEFDYVTYDTHEIAEIKLTQDLLNETLSLGNVVSKRLDLKLVGINPKEFEGENVDIILGIQIGSTNSIPPLPVYQEYDKGHFKITDFEVGENNVISLTGYDAIYFLGKTDLFGIPSPATFEQVVNKIASDNGLTVQIPKWITNTSNNLDIYEQFEARKLLGFIAEANGCNVFIEGQTLVFDPIYTPNIISEFHDFNPDTYYKFKKNKTPLVIASVEYQYSEDGRYISATQNTKGSPLVLNSENPFITENIISLLASENYFDYFGFELDCVGNFGVSLGNNKNINVTDIDGVEHMLKVYDMEEIFNGGYRVIYKSELANTEKQTYIATTPEYDNSVTEKDFYNAFLEERADRIEQVNNAIAKAEADVETAKGELQKEIDAEFADLANDSSTKKIDGNLLIERTLGANKIIANSITSMELTANYAELAEILSILITTDVLNASWANIGTALINKLTVDDAFIGKVTAYEIIADRIKSGTISALNDKFKINLNNGQITFHFSSSSETTGSIVATQWGSASIKGLSINGGLVANSYVNIGMTESNGFTPYIAIMRDNLTSISPNYMKGANITQTLNATTNAYFRSSIYLKTGNSTQTGRILLNTNAVYIMSSDDGTNFKGNWYLTPTTNASYQDINMGGRKILNIGTLSTHSLELQQAITYRVDGLKRQVAETFSNTIDFDGTIEVNAGNNVIELPLELHNSTYKAFISLLGTNGYVLEKNATNIVIYSEKATTCDYFIKAEKSDVVVLADIIESEVPIVEEEIFEEPIRYNV